MTLHPNPRPLSLHNLPPIVCYPRPFSAVAQIYLLYWFTGGTEGDGGSQRLHMIAMAQQGRCLATSSATCLQQSRQHVGKHALSFAKEVAKKLTGLASGTGHPHLHTPLKG